MLRITVHNNSQTVTLQLEGRLAGAWVEELDECWQRTLASEKQPNVEVDLTGLISIDRAGKAYTGGDAPPGCQLYCRRLRDEVDRGRDCRQIGVSAPPLNVIRKL